MTLLRAIGERHAEPPVTGARVGHANRTELDTVGTELLASHPVERKGRDAVACEVAVERMSMAVARLPGVADEHLPPAPAEHQGGAQSRRPASDDDHIEHAQHAAAKPSPEPPRWSLRLYVRLRNKVSQIGILGESADKGNTSHHFTDETCDWRAFLQHEHIVIISLLLFC